jgi:ABC-type transporter Mla subunit MlaD
MGTLSTQLNSTLTNLGALVAASPDGKVPGGGATPYDVAKLQGGAAMAKTLSSYTGNIDSLMSEMVTMGDTAEDIIDITQDLIDQTKDLSDTFSSYQDDITDMLDDCKELTSLTSNSIDSSQMFLSYSKSLLQEAGNKLDAAAKTSLSGTSDVLDKSINGLGDVKTMKNANETINRTIHNEFSEIEDKNHFINLDADAPLISFTSSKNPSPESIQVILRTQEISIDKADDNNRDLETEKKDIGVIARIKNILIKIKDVFTEA